MRNGGTSDVQTHRRRELAFYEENKSSQKGEGPSCREVQTWQMLWDRAKEQEEEIRLLDSRLLMFWETCEDTISVEYLTLQHSRAGI